jgi:hypothetical protein
MRLKRNIPNNFLIGLALLVCSFKLQAQYTPWADEEFPMNLYWGDTHLHTAYSVDANTMGNTALSPEQAYRFARGEAVKASNGMVARLNTPLDFLVVSDHAEQLGMMLKLRQGDPRILASPRGREIYEAMQSAASDFAAAKLLQEFIAALGMGREIISTPEVSIEAWRESIAIAEEFNAPGNFTALLGFEWTSMPNANNLHRVVVYADGAGKAGQLQPQPSTNGEDPAALWSFMERYEEQTGGRILAIPHNGNLSNGLMFQLTDFDGKDIDESYARRRAQWEPLVEVTQIKGDGEAHPFLSPEDEFADFETWDGGNFAARAAPNKSSDMLRHEYARSALKLGLSLEAGVGANPYQFGLIGSTDSHTSLATGAEDNYWGKASMVEPGADRTTGIGAADYGGDHPETELTKGWTFSASGYAAVWARDNTREEIFDAMRRREVYATTGSRIGLRFFGGWNFESDDIHKPNLARIGYRKGVPMGGELGAAGDSAPAFLVAAVKDPHGANLDRIQIVKGWLDSKGRLHEKIYNIAMSDGRVVRDDGRVEKLASTVDLEQATYSNKVGAEQLNSYWQDPDFDPEQRAFYYARVIEISTPRWSIYDAVRLGASLNPADPRVVQDRAYSSPIWYSP